MGWIGRALKDGCGKNGRSNALLMKEIVTGANDGEVSRDVASHESFYTISDFWTTPLRVRAFQNAERK